MAVYDIHRIAVPDAPPEYEDHTRGVHYVPAPCQVACPVGTDAPSYIAHILMMLRTARVQSRTELELANWWRATELHGRDRMESADIRSRMSGLLRQSCDVEHACLTSRSELPSP